jgi:hypothetical protein
VGTLANALAVKSKLVVELVVKIVVKQVTGEWERLRLADMNDRERLVERPAGSSKATSKASSKALCCT